MAMYATIFRTETQIGELVQAFENCSLSAAEFDHHAHMTVALWYLMSGSFADATERIRSNIQRFAAHHRQNHLYNETITLFWMKLLRHALDVAEPTPSLAVLVHQILTSWGNMRFVFSHYSRHRIFSESARQTWLEPDLLPLSF